MKLIESKYNILIKVELKGVIEYIVFFYWKKHFLW